MSTHMPPERAFRVLRAQGDRVSLRQLASIALACAGLGLGVISAAEQGLRAPRNADTREAAASSEPHARAAGSSALAAVSWPLLLAEAPTDGARASRANLSSAQRASAAPAVRKRALRLEREHVSTLRCETGAGPRGCPRARTLEQRVWRALRGLAACYGSATGPGSAQLQLELHRDRAPEIALFPADDGPSLNLRAVRGCVDPQLAKLSNGLAREERLVRFRFGLR